MNSDRPFEPTDYAAAAAPQMSAAARAPASRQWLWALGVVVLVIVAAIASYQRSEANRKQQTAARRRRARAMRADKADDEEPDPPASDVAPSQCQWCGSALPSTNRRRRYCDDARRMRFNRQRDQERSHETAERLSG